MNDRWKCNYSKSSSHRISHLFRSAKHLQSTHILMSFFSMIWFSNCSNPNILAPIIMTQISLQTPLVSAISLVYKKSKCLTFIIIRNSRKWICLHQLSNHLIMNHPNLFSYLTSKISHLKMNLSQKFNILNTSVQNQLHKSLRSSKHTLIQIKWSHKKPQE